MYSLPHFQINSHLTQVLIKTSFMESSGSSANSSEPHPHRWAEIIGAVMAFLTLTLPFLAIAYYSSDSLDVLPTTPYSLPRSEINNWQNS